MNTSLAQQSFSVAQYRAYLAESQNSGAAKVKRKTPEEDLHRQCFEWVSLMQRVHPVLAWMIHVPNGGKRPRGEAGKLKAMGAKPGFPDLFLPKKNQSWQGLAVELKSPIGRVSSIQSDWLDALEGEGYLCGVCRNFDEFEIFVKRYLGLAVGNF